MKRHPSRDSVRVIEQEDRKTALVFGMHWSVVIGARPQVLAAKRARAAGATHFVCTGQRTSAVGLVAIERRTGWQYWSAAASFALQHASQPTAAIIRLPEAGFWLIATRNAAVLSRTDRVFDSYAQACEALSALVQDIPTLHLVSEDDDPHGHGYRALLAEGEASPRLTFVAWRVRVVPKSIAFGACVVLGVAGGVAVAWFHFGPRPNPAEDTPRQLAQAESHAAAWRDARRLAALAAWQGGATFFPVLDRFRQLPVVLAGWVLAEADCRWRDAAWHCAATYGRQTVVATNAVFSAQYAALFNEQDAIAFLPFSQAQVRWTQAGETAPRDFSTLQSSAWIERNFSTRLQRYEPAFLRLSMGTSEPLLIPPPIDPLTAQPLSLDPTAPVLRQRAIEIEGPLRSFALLDDIETAAAWQQITLRWSAGSPVAINQSPLHLVLKGEIRENARDNP